MPACHICIRADCTTSTYCQCTVGWCVGSTGGACFTQGLSHLISTGCADVHGTDLVAVRVHLHRLEAATASQARSDADERSRNSHVDDMNVSSQKGKLLLTAGLIAAKTSLPIMAPLHELRHDCAIGQAGQQRRFVLKNSGSHGSHCPTAP